MDCKHCHKSIHPMHPTGLGAFVWAHDADGTSLCVINGQRSGTRAEPEE